MSFPEDIVKLRKRVADAVSKGVVNSDGKDFFEATLIQIMNDAEKNRQNCVQQAENLRRQAAIMDGQAGAFASVSSIVYNVLNGFVVVAEKDEEERRLAEEEKRQAEEEEKQAEPAAQVEADAKPKKISKKK